MDTPVTPVQAPQDYLLHLADNALVLGQRNAEWCGHGPILEEDIAMANISLDLIGQARLLYQLVAERRGDGCTEDALAYFRDVPQFKNYTLLELPHHGPLVGYAVSERDYATTLVRNFFYSALMVEVWSGLLDAADSALAAIAERSLKETRYHLRHSHDWLIRLGDGTEESHRRVQAAIDHLWAYTLEFWSASPVETAAADQGLDMTAIHAAWQRTVAAGLAQATLQEPADDGYVPQGKTGVHSEHLGYLLAEMQSLARAHPHGQW
ncbi:MAG: 1,2-phenylacetyl-CoA epoxidase subunit PaaC [Burkholderiaceae bacterium]|jgi:ring-1,2-phenylacetyl-CoA epoxidase subunit PaaC